MSEAHETAAEGVTRRQLFRAAVSGSGTATVGPAFVETASGRRDEEGRRRVGVGRRRDGASTTRATVRTDATAFGREGYTGLLVHLVESADGVDAEDGDAHGVERCRPGARGETLETYEATFVDESGAWTASTDLVVAGHPDIGVGALCLVTDQRRCDAEYAHLTLERLSASRSGSAATNEATGPDAALETVRTAASGVGALAGFTGLAAVLYLVGRRSRGR
ncbi:hypothetical protein [Haloprofundus salilacus]|uniref:hypothetical protein n=1 Tax=Haloprofundus salilacus TaxID=2876190 RepID=UPI001CCF4489|nr:hypothetical protein [Haloprofundus salilacus]